MRLHNPTNQSRLCASLGENLEPFEVREVAGDRFEKCEGCVCVVTADKAKSGKAEA